MSVRLERLIRIYNRLRRGPVTIEIISKWAAAASIKVSDRQLYRDLNELKNLHVAEGENVVEYSDEKNRKTWKLEYQENSEKLTQYDINSFFLLKSFAPYTLHEQRKHSIEKFEAILYRHLSKNKYQQSIDANELYLRRTNYMENLYGEVEHSQMEDLIWALHNKRVIVIEAELLNVANLHLPAEPFPMPMYPLELVFHRGRVHIAGLAEKDNRFVLFTLDKTFRFSLTNRTFNRKKFLAQYKKIFDSLFAISDPVNKRVYNIQIEFTKGFAESFMTYFWHHSQRWQSLSNGNYMLHLHCSIGRELIGFLATGLNKVKVHQPAILKNLYYGKLRETCLIYERDIPIEEESANSGY